MLVGQVVMLKNPPSRDEVQRRRDNIDEFWNTDGDSSGRVRQYQKILAYSQDLGRLYESRDRAFRASTAAGLLVCDFEIR